MAEVVTRREIGKKPALALAGVIAKMSSKRPSVAEAASKAWRNLAVQTPVNDKPSRREGNYRLQPSAFSLPEGLEAFLQAGIEFSYDKREFISPANIWEDVRVELIWRLQ